MNIITFILKAVLLGILVWFTALITTCVISMAKAQPRQYEWLPPQLDNYAWFMQDLYPWEMDDDEERTRLIITLDAANDWIDNIVSGSTKLALEEGWILSTDELKDIRSYAMGCVGPKEITWTHRISHALNIPAHDLPHLLHTRLNAHCALVLGDDNNDRQDLEKERISQQKFI